MAMFHLRFYSMVLFLGMSAACWAGEAGEIAKGPEESRLREVAAALQVYSADCSDAFPDSLAELVKGKFLEEIPSYDLRGGERRELGYVPGLSSSDPAEMICLYSPGVDGSGKRCSIRLDGSVEYLPEKDFQDALSQTRKFLLARKGRAKP